MGARSVFFHDSCGKITFLTFLSPFMFLYRMRTSLLMAKTFSLCWVLRSFSWTWLQPRCLRATVSRVWRLKQTASWAISGSVSREGSWKIIYEQTSSEAPHLTLCFGTLQLFVVLFVRPAIGKENLKPREVLPL